MTKAEQFRLTAWRLRVLRQAADDGNVARVCRRFGIPRKSFYKWRRRHAEHGDAGLCDRPRTPHLNGKVERSHRVDARNFASSWTRAASATTFTSSMTSCESGRTTTITI